MSTSHLLALARPFAGPALPAVAALARRLGQTLARALMTLATWRERARGRRQLAAMDARLRRDIGIGAADVYRELRKPFWIP